MRNLHIPATSTTCEVNCFAHGMIKLSGRSIPEDAAAFFFDMMDWVSDYYRKPEPKTEIVMALSYFNSASSSMFYKMFHTLNRLQITGKTQIHCTWYHEDGDEEVIQFVENLRDMASNIPIEFIEVESMDDLD